jgi:polyhydroxybutyrate depolymerase
MPLLLVLHGAGSDSVRFEAKTGYDELSDREGFIVAYADGVLTGADTSRTWNAGRCCPPASTMGVDDVSFLLALLDQLETTYAVDPSRVYAVGHSNGAMMAQRLGCEAATRFTAVASVAGSLQIPACTPERPVAMLEIHGSADRQVSVAAAQSSVASWRQADRCAAAADPTAAGPVTTQTWQCADQTEVRMIEIAGADHPWPGGRTPPPVGQRASDALDATAVTWAFLSTFVRSS